MATSSNSRSYRPAVLKKLFALSRNRCAFPICEELLSKPEWPKVLAKVCHIAGLNRGSARYDATITNVERNDYPNLLLLCPNHHELIDELEPERFSVNDLHDMKYAHESHRPGDREWCSDEQAEQFIMKLVVTHSLELLAPGETPREPIRSGSPMPDSVLPEGRNRLADDHGPEWPRGPRRVRDLANELGTTQRALLDLCVMLGVPARSKDTKLSEPYADLVRRRARRDGVTRPVSNPES
jgi:hypothetical protein